MIKESTVHKMKEIFGNDARRINHALKVLSFAEKILSCERLSLESEEIVIISAVLHDIGIHEAERKYNSSAGKYQEIEGPPIAEGIMKELGVQDDVIQRVCYIIGGHHTAEKNDGIDFQIIWEADLLVNIEEDGLVDKGVDIRSIIDKNFKTKSGSKIARDLYCKQNED